MSNYQSEIAEIDRRIADLVAARRRVQREHDITPAEPASVHGSTAPVVITFRKVFRGSQIYAAIKPSSTNLWTVTGRKSPVNASWDDVVAFIRYKEHDPEWALKSIEVMVSPNVVAEMVNLAASGVDRNQYTL